MSDAKWSDEFKACEYNVYNWIANDYKPVAEFDDEAEAIRWLVVNDYQYQDGNCWHGPDGGIYWLAGQRIRDVQAVMDAES